MELSNAERETLVCNGCGECKPPKPMDEARKTRMAAQLAAARAAL